VQGAEAAGAEAFSALPELAKVHILPVGEAIAQLDGKHRIEYISSELKSRRVKRDILRSGDLVGQDGVDFVVIKCDPPEGVLGSDTDYFTDGVPVVTFDKIQFSAWGPVEKSGEDLFKDCICRYFSGEYAPYGKTDTRRVRLLYTTQILNIEENYLQVEATEPPGLGVVTKNTEIFVEWDTTPEFDKVHIVPFQDTLPRAYDFDVFHDYLKPYLQRNAHKKFCANELFTYHGVQFKLVACEPEEVHARIGKDTTIFCDGMLHPSLRNLLPPDLLNQVSQLPPGLQMLLLNTERTTRELEDMLNQRRGLFEETLSAIDHFTWPPIDIDQTTQGTCMVCLNEFVTGEECRKLPCRHIFHTSCVDEWLRRCTDCPICKSNVDRAVRHY